MKFFFLLTLVALSFTNCTKTETEPDPTAASDLYVGNYTVNETRTYTDPSTSQPTTSTEQFLITINRVDDIEVEIVGFSNCLNRVSKANASESTLVITDSPPSVCGTLVDNNAPTSIIITKTTDGFDFTYNSGHFLRDNFGGSTFVNVKTTGTAVKS